MPIKYMYFLLVIIALVCGLLIRSASGEYRDPTTKVNVNEQTDLFEKSVDNLNDLQDFITNSRDEAVQKVGSGNVIDELGFDRNEINQEKNNLSSIEANDLNSRGQEEMMKQNDVNDLYVDYSRPLNKKHMQDAKKIASAQNGLMRNLLGKLRELGVDCKTVKGNKEKELTYYLQIVNEPYKDTIYNQVMCEDLRNKYNCNDRVTLQCVKKGKRYDGWQYRTLELSGYEINAHHYHWFDRFYWKKDKRRSKKYKVLMHTNLNVQRDIRFYLASILSVGIEQINEAINTQVSVRGDLVPTLKHRTYMHMGYTIGYNYRDAHDICLEWSEDWTEECRPQ